MKSLRTLTTIAKNIAHQMTFRSRNPHEMPRDHNHLNDQYRRAILAPDSALRHLGQMLTSDPHFLDLLSEHHSHYLIRTCVVGEELRACIYQLARFPCGLMVPAYREQWRKDDIVNYVAQFDEGRCSIKPVVGPKDVDETLTYDYYEPVRCYARPLTRDEQGQVDCYSRPHWSKVA